MRDVTIADIERLRVEADAADAVFEMDEETFRALYDRTSRALWAYLSRLTDADAADDLLQETYYRFLRAQGRHESEAHRPIVTQVPLPGAIRCSESPRTWHGTAGGAEPTRRWFHCPMADDASCGRTSMSPRTRSAGPICPARCSS